jgi:hypothetical protein
MAVTTEQVRIRQLLSTYAPNEVPQLPLDFGDFLSLLWRIDKAAGDVARVRYYQKCGLALSSALGLKNRSLYRLVEQTQPGELYTQLPNAPYRGTLRLVDAQDRKAAIRQLAQVRVDVMRMGTYDEQWTGGWPGSGITDLELRDRVFSVLFTALQGQVANYGRLLLVIDIVLGDLLLGMDAPDGVTMARLVQHFGYPDPRDPQTHSQFFVTV